MEPENKITGIILSGGKSIRMGENKAFIEMEGVPIISAIYSLFKELFQEVIIVTNQKELFTHFDSRIYADLIPNKGALGGLYTGIFFSTFHYSFCVACDMPFIKKSLVQYLIKNIRDDDVIVPRTKDGLQPLHAIYSKNCLDPIKNIIEQGKYKIIDFYHLVKIKIVEENDFFSLDPLRESFINVNTPEELLSVKRVKKTI
ncbi:MAG: molybdenum cofactor guanylyltransferase [Deltaproteobacteria bacterium CG03_land_8_20_14_0_80_45_14]|nr:MAG: molybdenum cofactor guanylyltransferase [Deltaproteobacteria bacterium CG03_land_8_20_14_0_80_45_14]